MTYYVGTMPVGEHLSHHGVKGMRWGQRRYQNPDGSLTAAGRVRYGVSNAYSRARSGIRSAGNRAGSWYKKNKKTIKRVAAVAGTAAAVAGTAYLGKKYGKGVARKAGNAFKVARSNFNQKRAQRFAKAASRAGYGVNIPGKNDWKKIRAINAKNAFKKASGVVRSGFRNVKRSASNATIRGRQNWYASKAARADARAAAKSTLSLNNGFRNKTNRTFGKAGSAVGGFARKAAGATGDAFRGIGYQARRTGAKAKNAARNLGYMAGNVKGNAKRTASKAGTAAKDAAYKAGSKAKTTAAKAKNAARNAKNIPGNAKRVAYNLKNNKMYRRFAAARVMPKVLDASVRASTGAAYYRVARSMGASKKAAAAIGTTRAIGGRRAGLGAAGTYGMYSFVKRANSPSAKRARARRKKKSRR